LNLPLFYYYFHLINYFKNIVLIRPFFLLYKIPIFINNFPILFLISSIIVINHNSFPSKSKSPLSISYFTLINLLSLSINHLSINPSPLSLNQSTRLTSSLNSLTSLYLLYSHPFSILISSIPIYTHYVNLFPSNKSHSVIKSIILNSLSHFITSHSPSKLSYHPIIHSKPLKFLSLFNYIKLKKYKFIKKLKSRSKKKKIKKFFFIPYDMINLKKRNLSIII
jgi:hypothetical protein